MVKWFAWVSNTSKQYKSQQKEDGELQCWAIGGAIYSMIQD